MFFFIGYCFGAGSYVCSTFVVRKKVYLFENIKEWNVSIFFYLTILSCFMIWKWWIFTLLNSTFFFHLLALFRLHCTLSNFPPETKQKYKKMFEHFFWTMNFESINRLFSFWIYWEVAEILSSFFAKTHPWIDNFTFHLIHWKI